MKSHTKSRGQAVTITKAKYDKLLADATVCEDTGHVFRDGEIEKGLQKSVDRIDCSRGYEPGNVCVVTWKANAMRGTMPIEAWRAAAAVMRENGQWS
jgi:hypothetical protein